MIDGSSQPGDDDRATAYHRALAGVGARSGAVGGYVQLGAHLRSGGGPPSPLVRDVLDVQQGYVELLADDRTRFLVGRAEMTFELVGARDAPNVRRSWDGGRATLSRRGWTADLFDVREVRPRPDAFDDTAAGGDRLSGLHVMGPKRGDGPPILSAFFYSATKRRFATLAGTARSSTRTLGGVLAGTLRGFDLSGGGAVQWGRFGSRQVSAFYLEGEIGRRFSSSGWRPRVAVRTSAFSGGAPRPDRIRTFDPLFPNYAYSTEAALQSPSNLVKLALLGGVDPARELQIRYRGEALWRFAASDAFYRPAGTPFVPPDATGRRWVGLQQQIEATWRRGGGLTLTAAVVRFDPGSFLKRAGQGHQTFGLLQAEWAMRR